MGNWESAEKPCASQRSLTLRIGYFPETVACLTYFWHAVRSEGCPLKGNTKLASTDTRHAQMWTMFSGGIILVLTCSHLIFLFCVDKHSHFLVCQKPLAFLHHSCDAVLHLAMFQAPSPAENGLSGLLESKFLEPLTCSESL